MFNLYRDIHMKKTLVALAVLAASGASFAQATLTGNYTFGYKSLTTAAGTTAGMGTDTAAIAVNASEDLGGGMKASAKVSLGGMMRDGAGAGEDASVSLSGGFGTVTMATLESGNGLLGIGSSGASGFGLDGAVISGSTNIDIISYSMPLSSSLTLGANYVDRASFAAGTSSGWGGTTGDTTGQASMGLALTYRAGAIAARGDYSSWARQGETLSTGVTGTLKDRVRLSAAYDLGVARLSAGFSHRNLVNGGAQDERLVGVAMPMGKVTVGLDYATATTTAGADKSGYSLGVSYALSKLTSISGSYYSATDNIAKTDATGYRAFVSKSF
jgi:hypothetical protein